MKKIILLVALIDSGEIINAQGVVNWNFRSKKISDKIYEIHFTPIVQSPWHIYSQTSPEGGALATKINFN